MSHRDDGVAVGGFRVWWNGVEDGVRANREVCGWDRQGWLEASGIVLSGADHGCERGGVLWQQCGASESGRHAVAAVWFERE